MITHDVPNVENITRVVLDNGITVLVYENFNVQSVVVSGSLHAGSMYETVDRNGLAGLTASALMRGTANFDFEAIHSALEDVGADVGVSSGTHRIGFNGKSLAEDLPLVLATISEVLRNPIFPADQVERLRGEVLTWLKYGQQDTRRQAARAFREMLYPPSHPYHYAVRGTEDTIPQITIEDMRNFHAKHYGPNGMVMVIVGAVEASKAVELVEACFGDWQNPNQPPVQELPTLIPPTTTQRMFVSIPGKTQYDLVLGVVGPSRFAADYYAASLANSILGQFGMMGRIGEIVREKSGMAYYASSRLEGGYGPGAWLISAGVNPKNAERAIELCLREIQTLSTEQVSETDLADNQSYYTGRLPLQLATNEGIAGMIQSMETYQLGLDYLLRYRDVIYQLTQEDLQAAAQHYWQPDAYVIAMSGTAEG